MAFNFFISCLFLTRCFIYLSEQNSKSTNCTKEEPCKYLSDAFNLSYPNSTEIHINENFISTNQSRLFIDLIYLCAKNKIKLCGQNQTINFINSTYNFTNEHDLYIENFTFFNWKSLLLQSDNTKMYFHKITFSHFKSQIMNAKKSNIELKSCLFIHNIVKKFNILYAYKSTLNFINCSFQSISQFPQSQNSIIYFNDSQSLFKSCAFTGNYINTVFFESSMSKISFLSCFSNKNGGRFFLKSINQFESLFDSCNFIENSCLLFNIVYSNFSIKNTSISHNCISDSFCLFNMSHSMLFNVSFSHNSCGPIINSSNSEINFTECNFSNNISPSNLISINSGKISINSSNWINSTTAYGSSIYAYNTVLSITNSIFNYSYSRNCGASIFARDTQFESISNSFLNSKSLQKGLSLCFYDCQQKNFKIDQTIFNNSQNEKDFSIYLDQCSGAIKNSFFYRTIDDEIPISLHNNCFNCSFQLDNKYKNSMQVDDYALFLDSIDNDIFHKTILLLIIILIFAITSIFFFRRNIRICLRRFARKRHN